MAHKIVGGSKGKAMPKKHGAGKGIPRKAKTMKKSTKSTAYEGMRKKVFGISHSEDAGHI